MYYQPRDNVQKTTVKRQVCTRYCMLKKNWTWTLILTSPERPWAGCEGGDPGAHQGTRPAGTRHAGPADPVLCQGCQSGWHLRKGWHICPAVSPDVQMAGLVSVCIYPSNRSQSVPRESASLEIEPSNQGYNPHPSLVDSLNQLSCPTTIMFLHCQICPFYARLFRDTVRAFTQQGGCGYRCCCAG